MLIRKTPDTIEKLRTLTRDSRYDLACACGAGADDQRRRSENNTWIYPVQFESGRRTFLFKTLLSNVCTNNCGYCPLRASRDPERCALTPEEAARAFMAYYRRGDVSGIFLSSGVTGTPDASMERIIRTARLIRNEGFRGFMHLKVMPGSSDAAVEQAVALANAVSVNIETAGEKHFSRISGGKSYLDGVIRPIKLISRLTGRGNRFARVNQTTQFIVGASDETDREIVKYFWGLYRRLGLSRVYFSAYQRGIGDAALPGERSAASNGDLLMREHRLYQADWLIRRYGFTENEIVFGRDGNLPLDRDPKETWALNNPGRFPVSLNRAPAGELLKVPGLGHITVRRIMEVRERGGKITSLEQLGSGKRLKKAEPYISFKY